MDDVCVIGGNRYFGRRLVRLLRDAGSRVTMVNRGSTAPPAGVDHVVADREDEAALTAALGDRTFDVILDQVCYTPHHADVATRVFAGRTARYVMTSTVEVYNPATAAALRPREPGSPLAEASVDTASWPVSDGPWEYAEGKRQAEGVLSRKAAFALTIVRCAHVLGGGADDFTGRLAHYTDRIRAGRPVAVHNNPMAATFIRDLEIADLLFWAAGADVVGPLNACSDGELTAIELCERIAARVGREPTYELVADGVEASPYSFEDYYGMDNARAARHGFAFGKVLDWLPSAIDEALAGHA